MGLPAWYLEGFESDSRKMLRVSLGRLPLSVGRGPGCDLVLHSQRVSMRHAEFFSDDDGLWLRDCGSTNGTFVNGKRLSTEQLLHTDDIVHFGDVEFRLSEPAPSATENPYARTLPMTKGDLRGGKYREFRDMVREGEVRALFQPIVNLQEEAILGYELLGQGLLDGTPVAPTDLFTLAETLDMAAELSRLLRDKGMQEATALADDVRIFVNTHPTELRDQETLLESLGALRQKHPNRPLVLEIHESAVTDAESMQSLSQHLKELDMGIAFDDFGIGQARLLELTDAAPHYLKFDVTLIRNLHRASKKRRNMLKTLVDMAHDLDIVSVAEGIEKPDEAKTCTELGFQFGQGFHYAHPLPVDTLHGD